MPATSHDVARLAGVSQPTVSRALRNQQGVAPDTRRRIEEAAAALGYVPSQLGRGLATRVTRRIGIVAAELTNPFYPHLVEPLHDRFERAGYRSVLFAEREDNHVAFADLVDGLLDAVVLTTTVLGSPLPRELTQRGLPFVFLNRDGGDVAADAVVMDNALGARLVADLLVDSGHRRIGAVFGPRTTSTGREREAGFRGQLATHGLDLPSRATVSGPFSFAAGRAGIRALLSSEDRPSAIFCANDVLALGALDETTRMGLRVPQDVSIIGFDDITMAGWERFSLTTVHSDLAGLAGVAADLLLERIADPDRAPCRVIQRPELVLRGSHASVSTQDRRQPSARTRAG